jgi:hypothetical protein
VTAKVQVHKFYKPQALHYCPHFFFRYSGRQVKLPITTHNTALVDKVIERSVESRRDFVKDGFHLFVTRCIQASLAPERRSLGREGILEGPPLLIQTCYLFALHQGLIDCHTKER